MKVIVYDYQSDKLEFILDSMNCDELTSILQCLKVLEIDEDELFFDKEHKSYFTTNYDYSFSTVNSGTHKVST